MTMSPFDTFALIIALISASVSHAGEKKPDVKQQEEALRQEAQLQITGTAGNREPVTGIFHPAPDAIANETPLPKVIGVLIQKGQALPLMVNQKATLDFLTRRAGHEVTLMAKYLDKGAKGKWLIADEVVLTSGGGATIIRKRGGL
jgi:hypothetical protein